MDYHLPLPGARQLREIFRLETERTLGNDWVVRHDNRFYQVEAQSRNYAPAKSRVTVCEWEDGTMEIHYRGRELTWREIEQRPGKPEPAGQKRNKTHPRIVVQATDHPWRKSYQDMKPWRSPPTVAPARSPAVASPSAPP